MILSNFTKNVKIKLNKGALICVGLLQHMYNTIYAILEYRDLWDGI